MPDPLSPGPEAWPLDERPGFLVRRLHQIHEALFNQACGSFGVTPVQYSLMSALAELGEADQGSLALRVALDRVTAAGALARLEKRGLVRRPVASHDRRARACRLTGAGLAMLARMEAAARSAHADTLRPLAEAERAQLVALLGRIVSSHVVPGAPASGIACNDHDMSYTSYGTGKEET